MEGSRILPVTQKYHLQSDAHIFQRTKEPMKKQMNCRELFWKKNEVSKNEFFNGDFQRKVDTKYLATSHRNLWWQVVTKPFDAKWLELSKVIANVFLIRSGWDRLCSLLFCISTTFWENQVHIGSCVTKWWLWRFPYLKHPGWLGPLTFDKKPAELQLFPPLYSITTPPRCM